MLIHLRLKILCCVALYSFSLLLIYIHQFMLDGAFVVDFKPQMAKMWALKKSI